MIVFDPNETPKAVRRYFSADLFFEIHPLSRKDKRRIRKEAEEQAGGDPEKFNELVDFYTRRHICRGWGGVVDPDGHPIPFRTDLLTPIFETFGNLETWALAEATMLNMTRARERAAKLKNLPTSHDGSDSAPGA